MNELVKKETALTSQEEEHIPQIGDHYLYNSHGYERIIRVERQTERGFLVSTMQENGEFEVTPGGWFYDEPLYRFKELTFLPDFREDYVLAEKLLNGELVLETDNNIADTTALTTTSSVATLLAMEEKCRALEDKFNRVRKVAEAKVRAAQRQMEAKMNTLKEYCSGLSKQIGRIQEALSLIDLYTGKSICVETLREGKKAKDSEVFYIRQQLLYMDEECKITFDEGIDATNTEDFVKWLLTDQRHIDQVIPEQKAVVAIKPRRAPAKDYGDSRYSTMVEQWNRYTYFLFRNGENLYSVDSEDFQVYDRLIPTQEDLERLQRQIDEAKKWHKDTQEIFERFNLRFYRFLMFLQGVINTTDILKPLPDKVNLFDEGSYKDCIQVIYDDENILADGKPSYKEWVKQMNKDVAVGSRVIYTTRLSPSWSSSKSSHECWGEQHLLRYYRSQWSMPEIPASGVYELKCVDLPYERSNVINVDGDKRKALGFLYEDERPREFWEKNQGKRNKVTCLLLDYDNFINYDALDLDELEYYLTNRVYRTQYLSIVPILLKAREELREEKRQEEAFRDLLINNSVRKDITPAEVDEAITWWKLKNKYKRPISKDCTKAMRMIKQRLKL